ncbi:MAG: transaldolase family protein [Roseinatronobacter sp.]
MPTYLDQLRQISILVADTGSVDAVRTYQPVDCTTNPSLVLAAFGDPALEDVIGREMAAAKAARLTPEATANSLAVAIGAALSALVSGRVSTEVEARLSFDAAGSVARARQIIAAYGARGIGRERVLIKLAATWEGIRAAEILQREGIDCNMTLIFARAQAIAAADAGAWLISPFVGRITDWYKARDGRDSYPPEEDPGVASVRGIHEYFKSNGIETIIMAASFRTVDQICALAGCDRLTIAPKLFDALAQLDGPLPRQLSPETATPMPPVVMDEATFRWDMAADAMANEKLAEGLRQFHKDHLALCALVAQRLQAA